VADKQFVTLTRRKLLYCTALTGLAAVRVPLRADGPSETQRLIALFDTFANELLDDSPILRPRSASPAEFSPSRRKPEYARSADMSRGSPRQSQDRRACPS
jgi:hypothetical protein